jgi:hypothetical protein
MAGSSTSLVAFLIGAALGGRLAVGNGRSATPPSRLYAVIVLTALAMGLRNATVVGVLVATVAYPH